MTCRRGAIAGTLAIMLAVSAGCERNAFEWIAGPSVTPVATARPLTWDTAPELDAWVHNSVSSGAASVETGGGVAFIRILLGGLTVLRSPDFDPPVAGTRGIRVRFRWFLTLDPGTGGRSMSGDFFFAQPVVAQPYQVRLSGFFQGPATTWQQTDFLVQPSGATVDARYVYLRLSSPPGSSSSLGQLEFDSLEILR